MYTLSANEDFKQNCEACSLEPCVFGFVVTQTPWNIDVKLISPYLFESIERAKFLNHWYATYIVLRIYWDVLGIGD